MVEERVPTENRRTPLATIRCALCNQPIAQMSRVTAALAGGMCTRESCVKDERHPDRKRQVFTFNRMVEEL